MPYALKGLHDIANKRVATRKNTALAHAVMYLSRTAHTVMVAKETRAFPTIFF